MILTGNPTGGILQCPASGGNRRRCDACRSATAGRPPVSFLPVRWSPLSVFACGTVQTRSTPASTSSELGSAAEPGAPLIATGFQATFVASVDDSPGVIVFARDGRLFGQHFDDENLKLLGAPTQLADRIGSYLDFAYFAASPTTLVYRAPEPPSQLTWFSRDGRDRTGRRSPTCRRPGARAIERSGARRAACSTECCRSGCCGCSI